MNITEKPEFEKHFSQVMKLAVLRDIAVLVKKGHGRQSSCQKDVSSFLYKCSKNQDWEL